MLNTRDGSRSPIKKTAMADTITIARGDTLSGVLKSQRKLKDHEIHAWVGKLRVLNPHISDPDRIYPGEQLLIPDSLMEIVPDTAVWSNAFSKIPRALTSPHNGHTQLFLAVSGTTIDTIAKRMFAEGAHRNLPLSTKRAILIHNNPDLLDCLDTNLVPADMMVDITPLRLSKFDKIYWQGERPLYQSYLESFDGRTRDMFQQTGPEESYLLAEMVQTLAEAGAAVGVDGLVTSAASDTAAAGQLSLVRIDSLARLIYEDAARQFGRKASASLTKANLAQLGTFIKAHPSYPAHMREMEQVPRFLLPMSRAKLLPPSAANVNSAAFSHYFVKQHFQAFRRWPSSKYMGSIARQLNGRINLFHAAGRYATWYVPAVIGLYNVYDAPPGMRVKTVFEEGFGIIGGWAGTQAGL